MANKSVSDYPFTRKHKLKNKQFNEQVKFVASVLSSSGLTGVLAVLLRPLIEARSFAPSPLVAVGGILCLCVAFYLLGLLRAES